MDPTDWEARDDGNSVLPLQQTKKRPRQSPGAACEECRRRKLRCDRKSPQCGVCAASNIACHFNQSRTERAPRSANLQQLQQRMAALEERLSLATDTGLLLSDPILTTPDITKLSSMPLPSTLGLRSPPSPTLRLGTEVSALMREELDQLYFDRAHDFAPMIHQGRYACWNSHQPKTESKEALQYAMWTLGATFSAHFQHLAPSLYDETRHVFDLLEVRGRETDITEIEHLQACLLLTMYEFMHSYDRRGWMRAGYAFRIVQLMRLFELDTPSTPSEWVEVEEKRRTFWVAFCLDRFLSIRNKWPLTLIEHLVSAPPVDSSPEADSIQITSRLPAPETAFQCGQPVVMEFLADAISSSGPTLSSPFAELVIVATVCGRALIHHYQALVESNYNTSIHNFHDRQNWIHNTLVQRLEILAAQAPVIAENADSLILFTRMLCQTTVLYLYHTLELSAYSLDSLDISTLSRYNETALVAAQEMALLTRVLGQMNSFKIHPFTPIPLSLCADFFGAYRDPSTAFYAKLQEVFQALRNIKCVNSLGDKLHQILESSKDQQAVMTIENGVSVGEHEV